MSGKIGYVNGLRALAIIMVLMHHLYAPIYPPQALSNTSPGYYFLLQPLFSAGWLGVNIFFVLSGFVLYLPFAKANEREVNVAEFLKRRGKRLLPLYYLNVSVCLILFLNEPLSRLAAHAVIYGVALFPSPALFFPPNNPPLWSLGIEIGFSVLFPFIAIAMRKWGASRTLVILIVMSAIYHALGAGVAQPPGKYLNDISDMLPGRLSDFCFGMLAALTWTSRGNPTASSRRLVPAAFTLMYAASLLSTARFLGELPPITQTFANLAIGSGTALFIVALKNEADHRRLRAVLSYGPLQLIGLMCFSIYIWHWQIIQLVDIYYGSDLWPTTPIVAFYLLILFTVSALSYRFVEFPQGKARELFFLQAKVQPSQ